MKDEKKIKISLGMTICFIIIFLLLITIITIYIFYTNQINKLNEENDVLTGIKRHAVSSEVFKTAMTTNGFNIHKQEELLNENALKEFGSITGYITENIDDNTFRINFWEFTDENHSIKEFYDSVLNVETDNNGIIEENIEKSLKTTRYTATSNGYYFIISRIDNTLFWGTIKIDKKIFLDDIANNLGY